MAKPRRPVIPEAVGILVAGVYLVLMFLFFTLLPTLGGAMGAKVLEKE